jgi:hypothetical protein
MATAFVSVKSLKTRFDAIRTLQQAHLIPETDRYRYSIKDLKVGGFIRVEGCVCFVTRHGRYDEYDESYKKKQGYSAHEFRLLNLENGEIINIEWEEDDELKVFISTEMLSFSDLCDELGEDIDEDDLDDIVGDEDCVVFDSMVFDYEEDWAAKYFPEGQSKAEKAYIYEFSGTDGIGITIEEWGDGEKQSDYEIWLTRRIDPDAIEIISLGGN